MPPWKVGGCGARGQDLCAQDFRGWKVDRPGVQEDVVQAGLGDESPPALVGLQNGKNADPCADFAASNLLDEAACEQALDIAWRKVCWRCLS